MVRKIGIASGAILLCLGIVSFLYLGIGLGEWAPNVCALNLVPGFFLWALVFICRGRSRQQSVAIATLGMPIFLVGLGYVVFVNAFVIGLSQHLSPVTKVSEYSKVLEELQVTTANHGNELIEHIPRAIPVEASDVMLYYQRGFFQGGTYFQVRYTLPWPEIQRIQEKYSPAAKETINAPEEWAQKGRRVPYLFFRNRENNENTSPADVDPLQIMVLHMSEPENWNHSYSSGVAISKSRRMVVYWVNDG